MYNKFTRRSYNPPVEDPLHASYCTSYTTNSTVDAHPFFFLVNTPHMINHISHTKTYCDKNKSILLEQVDE